MSISLFKRGGTAPIPPLTPNLLIHDCATWHQLEAFSHMRSFEKCATVTHPQPVGAGSGEVYAQQQLIK